MKFFGTDSETDDESFPLHEAARNGQERTVKLHLEKGTSFKSTDSCGMTPLHCAVLGGHKEIVRLLLDKGAYIDIRMGPRDHTPLHLACKICDQRVVKLLLDKGANVNALCKNRNTPLHIALSSEDDGNEPYCSMLLLDHGADINIINNSRESPLYMAAMRGFSSFVEDILLRKPIGGVGSALKAAIYGRGKNYEKIVDCLAQIPGQQNVFNSEILHKAALNGHFSVIKVLFNSNHPLISKCMESDCFNSLIHCAIEGKHVEILRLILNYRKRIHTNDETLHFATKKDWTDGCKLILEHGSDVNARDEHGDSAIFYAKSRNIAKLLLENGARLDARTNLGLTPLHVAVQNDHEELVLAFLQYDKDSSSNNGASDSTSSHMVSSIDVCDKLSRRPLHYARSATTAKLLLKYGAKPDTEKQCYSPLHAAVQNHHDEVVSILLQYGAAVNSTTLCKSTSLHIASGRGHRNIANILLSNGAKVNAAREDGSTPLCDAVLADHIEIVEDLLNSGANDEVRMQNGHMPLHYAAEKGRIELLKCLLRCNVYIDLQNQSGDTALHLACKSGYLNAVFMLIECGADVNIKSNDGKIALDRARIGNGKYELAACIDRHVVKLKVAGLYLCEENMIRASKVSSLEAHKDNCRAELEIMMGTKLDLNISLYEILSAGQPHCILSEDVIRDLDVEHDIGLKKFPLYRGLMAYKFRSLKHRTTLVQPARRSLSIIVKINSNNHLPSECIKKIFLHLENRDLKNLILSCESL